ncbi:MAG TPA: peptidoglycan-binding protein [Baekduia sp.]|nr:peptidoglycan-binding protein [Baekduia sp.]
MRRATAMAVVLLLALAAVPAAAASSSDVAALQVALRARGLYAGTVDGVPGPRTSAAVVAFQRRAGLVADGIAGPMTRRALGRRGRPWLGHRVLHAPERGWDAAALQYLLGRMGFPSGPVDGILGPRADAALRRFQAWAGLTADGLAGPATIAALRRAPPRSPLRFAWPLRAPVGDGFGPRGDMVHTGIDFEAAAGARVGAAGRGCVASAGWSAGGYGNLVVVRHRLGMTSWYAHLSSIAVRPGRCLTAGDRIGRVGATGRATGPHLHFELRLRGAAVDPRTGGVG